MSLQLHRGKLGHNAPGALVFPDDGGRPFGVVGWPEWWPAELIARFAAIIIEAVIDLTEWPSHRPRRRGVVRCYELTAQSWLEVPAKGGLVVGACGAVDVGLRSQGPLACALVVEIGNALLADDAFTPLDDAAAWPPIPVDLGDMFERHEAGLPPLREARRPPPPQVDPRQGVLF